MSRFAPQSSLEPRPRLRKTRSDYQHLKARRQLGSGLASYWLGVVLAGLGGPASGCLVTDQITFEEEPNVPPVLLKAPGVKEDLGSIVWIDRSMRPTWDLRLKVRDENVEQDLVAHFRVKHEGEEFPPFDSIDLPAPPDGSVLRDLLVIVQTETLYVGECHRLEVAVSGSFFPFEERPTPAFFDALRGPEDDIFVGMWWIWEGPGEMQATPEAKARLVESCNAIEVLGGASAVEQMP